MGRLSFKEQCIALRKQDYTLTQIVKITGRPKTSVHFHIQSLPLTEGKREKIRKDSTIRLLRFSLGKKGKSKKSFNKFEKWDLHTVSLVSHFLFDGEIKHGGCIYNNRNTALLERVRTSMKRIYAFEPSRYENKFTGVKRISYFNVALGAYIKDKAAQLLKEVPDLSSELKKEFIRSFFDDEGCMDYRIQYNRRMVRGYQKDVRILKLIQQLLVDFEISSKIRQPNEIIISGKTNLVRFQKEINFSPGVRINGNRPNSIWKKSLEKRQILDMAIKSFRA